MKWWRDERGGALMLAVGYLAVMTLAASGFLTMLNQRLAVVRDQERAQWCRHLAEAGVEAAIDRLAADTPYSGEEDAALGRGRYSVAITAIAPRQVLVEARGELVYDGTVVEHRTVRAVVTLAQDGSIAALEWHGETP